MRRLRGALIGFGAVAENGHAPAYTAGAPVELVAVADASAERLERARALWPGLRAYASLDALLSAEADLDFVDVATPPFCHAEQARAALARGLHVLCEKPLTLDPAEFQALRRAAERAGRALFAVHNWAYSPQWVKVAALARSGSIGKLQRVELVVRRTQPSVSALPGDWRKDPKLSGGGILVDHGWHALYLVHRLLGGEATLAAASLSAPVAGAADEESVIRLRYPAAEAAISLTWRAAARANTATLVGSRGRVDLLDDRVFLRSSGRAEERFDFAEPLSKGSAHPAWFSAMLGDFAAAAADPAAGAANLDEAAFCARMIRAAYDGVSEPVQ